MHEFTEALMSFAIEARKSVVVEPNIDTYRFDPFPGSFARFNDSYLRDLRGHSSDPRVCIGYIARRPAHL